MHSTTTTLATTRAESQSHIKYRRDIDGLRAVAVLCVLMFHAFPHYMKGGFVGVDIFFVISGFLITKVIATTLGNGTFSVAGFYARRVRRIFPALMLTLLACMVFGWKTMLADDLTQLAKHIFGGATFSSNLLLWQEAGYFDAASERKPLLHLWSLGIEEQFYIVWPLLMWWGWRNRVSPLILIAIVGLSSFFVNVVEIARHPIATFYSPASRAWELLLGAGLAYVAPAFGHDDRPAARHGASVLGIALILISAFCLKAGSRFPGWWALAPSVGAGLVIWAGPSALLNRLLASRLMVGIGLISFPLYLWHWPLLALGRDLVPAGEPGRAMLLLIAALLALATYELIEKPIRFGAHARAKVFGLSMGMLIIGTGAIGIFQGKGLPQRYPEIVQNATKYDLEAFRNGIRWKRCFLEFEQEAPEFAPECVEHGNAPLVAMWGDSSMAALSAGFKALSAQSHDFRLAQVTSSACPPIMDYALPERPECRANNRKALALLQLAKPKIVVLAALWQGHDNLRVAATIAELKRMGVARVILLGPGVVWREPPGKIILRLWKNDPLHRLPPARLDYNEFGLYETTGEPEATHTARVDAALEKVARDAGAEYISIFKKLCNGRGCLMRSSERSGESLYLDQSHLNPSGAEFVVGLLAPELRLSGGSQ